ncbi:hypothetical protein EHM92_00315 [bacterium]|nr:MAG: hypothetical protein EHM92_00315 [bacterium]
MTAGRKAFKTKLYIGDQNSPESFFALPELFSIGAVGGSKELVDMTNHDTLGQYDYLVFDLEDGNEIQFEANDIHGDAQQGRFRTAYANAEKHYFQILDRNLDGYQFPGVITKLETDFSELKGKVVIRGTLKIAGTVTTVTATP